MCGGTWPPFQGEPTTRIDDQISLDGTDDLIDAAFMLLGRKTADLKTGGPRHRPAKLPARGRKVLERLEGVAEGLLV